MPRSRSERCRIVDVVDGWADDSVAGIQVAGRHDFHGLVVDVSFVPDVVDVHVRLNRLDEPGAHGVGRRVMVGFADVDFPDRSPDEDFNADVAPFVVQNFAANIAAGIEPELAVGQPEPEAERVFVFPGLRIFRVLHKQVFRWQNDIRIELVFRLRGFQTDRAVAADVENLKESLVLLRRFLKNNLVPPPDDKRGSFQPVRLFLILNEFEPVRRLPHFHCCNRSVVVRIGAVKSFVKVNVFPNMSEAGKEIVSTRVGRLPGVKRINAAMVRVEMGTHHIVDVVACRVNPLNIPGDPFSRITRPVRKKQRSFRRLNVELAGVEKHGRPVRENLKARFRPTGVDVMQIKVPLFPASVRLADFRTVRQRRRGRRLLGETGTASA